jgi:hypothetical protein
VKVTAKYFTNTCVVDTSGRRQNLDRVLARGLEVAKPLPERTGSLAIVGSGPSVRDFLDELKTHDEIWAINGAYDYLQSQGIVPHGFFGIDPLPGLAAYVGFPHQDTTFYIASSCDPSVFDALKGRSVKLWHPAAYDTEYPKEDGVKPIIGGTTAITRAPYFALYQGWRDITLYGADSSYSDDGTEYCYKWGTYGLDIDQPKHESWVGDEMFITEVGLLKQVSFLEVMGKHFNGMLKFKSKGLIDAYLRAPMSDIELEVEEDAADAA